MKLLQVILLVWFIGIHPNKEGINPEPDVPKLRIVEVVAKGSLEINEFGKKKDWIKIENYGDEIVDLSAYKLFISDNKEELNKFRLRKKVLAPKSTLLIWCDDYGITRKEIHTNFKLSSEGEVLTLSIKKNCKLEVLDQVSYSKIEKKNQLTLTRTNDELVITKK